MDTNSLLTIRNAVIIGFIAVYLLTSFVCARLSRSFWRTFLTAIIVGLVLGAGCLWAADHFHIV